VHVDNKSAIAILQNYVLSDKSKHFLVKFHYVRELVASGDIDFKYVETYLNIADLLTKPLPGPRTKMLAEKLGIVDHNICTSEGRC